MGQLFGKKEDTTKARYFAHAICRQDTAKCANGGLVIAIDKNQFEKVRSETLRSEPEQKLEFLMLYIPKLRTFGRKVVEKLDFIFVKESYTKGCKIIKEGTQSDNVYFVKSGCCRALIPLSGPLAGVKAKLGAEEQNRYKYAVMYTLSKWE